MEFESHREITVGSLVEISFYKCIAVRSWAALLHRHQVSAPQFIFGQVISGALMTRLQPNTRAIGEFPRSPISAHCYLGKAEAHF
jgi:hypothetical protein